MKFTLRFLPFPAASAVAALALAASAHSAIAAQPDPKPVVVAVDGLKMVRNLPVLLADRLGYFKAQGLDVTFKETSADAAVDEMLADGRVAGMAAYYHHTIVAQVEEHNPMEAVITLAVTPGYQVLLASSLKGKVNAPADLKGRRIISGGAHSAKTTSANWLVMHAGYATADFTRLSTADKAKIAESLKDGEADLVIAPEPDASAYVAQGVAVPFADLYSVEGTRKALGSVFPSSVLYMSPKYVAAHPEVAQQLVNALADSLQYINSHSVDDIRHWVPDVIAGEAKDPRVLAQGVKMFATDGKMPAEAAAMEAAAIAAQFPQYAQADLGQTFTNSFVTRALARVK